MEVRPPSFTPIWTYANELTETILSAALTPDLPPLLQQKDGKC